ncbi:hypothetical protein [Spiroplasma endosymbiont of Amphibalanus improvisus]|uniref:hypothetical protein n=1 Tax=Spiroplasma endosymbiont of Amphibalanus improvisus TaxID=3066327 RepID=UPI00313EE7F6
MNSILLITVITFSSIFGANADINNFVLKNENDYQTKNKIIDNFDNNNNNDLTEFRAYVDSSGDTWAPKDNVIDLYNGNGPKDTWLGGDVNIAQININDYSDSKEDFINNYNVWNCNFNVAYNGWDSKNGWTNSAGKNAPYGEYSGSININNNNKMVIVTDWSDTKRKTHIQLWYGYKWSEDENIINFYAEAKVSYSKDTLSVINHASLLGFQISDFNGSGSNSDFNIKNNVLPVSGILSTLNDSYMIISLDSLFELAYQYYLNSIQEHWFISNFINASLELSGTGANEKEIVFSQLLIFNNPIFLEDLNSTLQTGIKKNSEFKFVSHHIGNEYYESAYYINETGEYLISTSNTILVLGEINILYNGLLNTSMMYTIFN